MVKFYALRVDCSDTVHLFKANSEHVEMVFDITDRVVEWKNKKISDSEVNWNLLLAITNLTDLDTEMQVEFTPFGESGDVKISFSIDLDQCYCFYGKVVDSDGNVVITKPERTIIIANSGKTQAVQADFTQEQVDSILNSTLWSNKYVQSGGKPQHFDSLQIGDRTGETYVLPKLTVSDWNFKNITETSFDINYVSGSPNNETFSCKNCVKFL